MTYVPTEIEKRIAAVVQALAAFFLFLPPAVALQTVRTKRSPYIQYWAKTCLVWSLVTTVLIAAAIATRVLLELPAPPLVLLIVHAVFCITGALSAYFNTPFKYWFVADKCCETELGNVYGQLTSKSRNIDDK